MAAGDAIELDGIAVRVAEGFGQRLRGLMFSASLPPRQALLLTDCASVHTCFMRFPIDLVYLDKRGVVTQLVSGLKPWRASIGKRGSVHALELAACSIDRLNLHVGDDLSNARAKKMHAGVVGCQAEAQVGHALGVQP